MNSVRKSLSILLLLPLVSTPAFADFKYTDTSQITGGALMGMASFAAKFSKDSRAAMQPITTTHYIKGNKMRTDGSDGSIQIIDLDGRRIISIDNQKRTYSVSTFEEIKAAMEKARQDAAAKAQQNPGKDGKPQDAQLQVTPKITVLPGSGSRTILGQDTKETKVKMDMEMQAQNNGQAPPPKPGEPNSITFTMTMDTFVAPSVSGYQEIGEFYKKMAKEVNWVPPSNIHVDPRMTQGMSELQKNSDALKGLPMLSYITMGIPPQPGSNPNGTQNTSNPSSSDNSKSTDSGSSVPTSGSDAVVKGLGSLFNKRKKQQDDNAKAGTPAPPPNPNPDPNALMEMTTQVSSFSDSPLDASLFDIPAGFTQVQADANQMLLAPTQTRRH